MEAFETSFSRFEREFEASKYMDGVTKIIRQQPSIAFWASPPIGCCFALCPFLPCGKPQTPSSRLLASLRR